MASFTSNSPSSHIASTTSPNKRQKVQQSELVKYERLWMDDGNIIVAVPDDKDGETTTYAFRCHKSILALQSPVFQDLFTLPQPDDAEQFDGVPVVRLPDAFEDVKYIVEMLYYPSLVPVTFDPFALPPALGGGLRLTSKYGLASLRTRIVEAFERSLPKTLTEWDAMPLDDNWGTHIFRLLQLAEDAQLPDILPTLYYMLHLSTQLPAPVDAESMPWDVFSATSVSEHQARIDRLCTLPPPYLGRLTIGREWLRLAGLPVLKSLVYYAQEQDSCQYSVGMMGRIECEGFLTSFWGLREGHTTEIMLDPLGELSNIKIDIESCETRPSCGPCKNCYQEMVRLTNAARQYVWDSLPVLFGMKTMGDGAIPKLEVYLNKA